jgi:RNA polymerase sigma-70 factor, ECF subfamily
MNFCNGYKSDEALLTEIQSGSKEAFEVLYRTFYPDLCDYLYRYIDTPTICEELIQDLFMNIWMNRESWNPTDSLSSYLYVSARNRALDYLKHLEVEERYLKSQKISINSRIFSMNDLPEDLVNREDKTELDDFSMRVEEAILNLPPRSRQIFRLSREDGLTYREIAEYLGLSVKTVETQIGRALQKLRDNLTSRLTVLLPIISLFVSRYIL